MKRKLKFYVLILVLLNFVQISFAQQSAPPYSKSIHKGWVRGIFSNQYMVGEYNGRLQTMEVTFKQNIDNVEFIIYKDGNVCENDYIQHISKADMQSYILSTYGSGDYTIIIKVNGIIVVSEILSL